MRYVHSATPHPFLTGGVLIMAAAAAVATIAVADQTTVAASTPAQGSKQIMVAESNGVLVPLDGRSVERGQHVVLTHATRKTIVTYYLDGLRHKVAQRRAAPYIWTVSASAGRHSLTAVLQVEHGRKAAITAPFTVVAAPTGTPATNLVHRPSKPSSPSKVGAAPSRSPAASTTPLAAPTSTPSATVAHAPAPTTSTPAPVSASTTSEPTQAASSTGTIHRLFGTSSLWNTAKSGFTFATAADGLLRSSTYGINNGAYSHPTYFASPSDPMMTFRLGAGWGFPATTITTPAPRGMAPASGGDGVMSVLMTDGRLLDMYQVTGGGISWSAKYYGLSDGVNGSGFGANGHGIGTTAIGSPQAAGTILAGDVTAGVIRHALCMAWDYSALGGVGTGGLAVAPAVSNDDGGGSGPLPEGGLLIIPAGASRPAGLSPMGTALWNAAQTYGVFITDQLGGNPMFYGDGSATVGNAFSGSDLTAVGRALRLAKTW